MRGRPRLLVLGIVIGLAAYVTFVRMGPYPVPEGGNPPGIAPDSLFAAHYRQFVGGRLLDICFEVAQPVLPIKRGLTRGK